MFKPLTKEQVMDKIQLNNHDKNYDYSKLIYTTTNANVIVICKEHGEFEVKLSKHISGSTCPKCKEINEANRIINLNEMKKKTKLKEIDIINNNTDNTITTVLTDNLDIGISCTTHGLIKTLARKSRANETYTPKCTACQEVLRNKKTKENEFKRKKEKQIAFKSIFDNKLISLNLEPEVCVNDSITKLLSHIHANKYTYDINHSDSVKLTDARGLAICKEHGEFSFNIANHMEGKANCPICAGAKRLTKEDVLKRFNEKHKNRFDYSKMKYVNTSKKIIVRCNEHNRPFKVTPSNHENSRNGGCPECSESGFRDHIPGILYYLSIDNGKAYKIGITNYSVEERYTKKDLEKIKILKEWKYEIGKDARTKESVILKEFDYAKYQGDELLSNGNTELFDRDVFHMDNNIQH